MGFGVGAPVVQREELREQLDALQPVALISGRDDALQLREQVGDHLGHDLAQLEEQLVRVRVRVGGRVSGEC